MFDRLDAKSCCDVGFTSAGSTQSHDIVCAVYELATMELFYQGFVHLAGCKVEPGQILIGREPCRLDLVGDGPDPMILLGARPSRL